MPDDVLAAPFPALPFPALPSLADTGLATELRRWRRANPDATLAEIETALDARLDPTRAALLAELATDSPDASAGRGACPACGGRLERRGERTRTLRTRGDAPLVLRRTYAVCSACGAGLSPP